MRFEDDSGIKRYAGEAVAITSLGKNSDMPKEDPMQSVKTKTFVPGFGNVRLVPRGKKGLYSASFC